MSKSGSDIASSPAGDATDDDVAFDDILVKEVAGLVGEGVELDRAWAAGEEDACARAFESSAAARIAWLALEVELPEAFFGGIVMLFTDVSLAVDNDEC